MPNMKNWITALALCALASASPIKEKRQAAGQLITSCTVPGDVAIAFDDGPFVYTSSALDQLDAAGMKATFFLNGQNYDNINNYASVVQRMYSSGFQIGSHTYDISFANSAEYRLTNTRRWAHADLSTLDQAGITDQMTQLESALVGIIGVFPTYMRPPYFGVNDLVLSTLGGLGYKVIEADVDSQDWQYAPDQAVTTVNQLFDQGGRLTLLHDPLQATVESILPGVIQSVQSRGLRAVTVGECLGDSPANFYRTSRDGGSTTPPPSNGGGNGGGDGGDSGNGGDSGTIRPDGQCGGTTGGTCASGECCSQYGYCGSGPDFGC